MKKALVNKKVLFALILLTLVAAIIVAIIIIFPRRLATGGNRDTVLYEIPRIKTTVTSAADGSAHNLTTKFSLAVDTKTSEGLNNRELQLEIIDILSNLDYDQVIGKDSMTYLKQQVLDNITSVDKSKIKAIYISELMSGENVIAGGDSNGAESRDGMTTRLKKK